VDSAINLSFRYSEGDYVRALRAHYRSRLRLRLDLAVAIVVGILGIYLWPSFAGVASVAVSVLLVLMLVAAFFVIPPLVFRREPKFRDDYSLTFSSEGIHFRTAHIDSQLQWSMYSRALIDSYSYVLYYGSSQFSVIPRRVFRNVDEQREFEEMLAKHVPIIEKVA
jgi:YcxB-like protein